MNREDFDFEFVDSDFSAAGTGTCPNCRKGICFLPDITSQVKSEYKPLLDLEKTHGIRVTELERIRTKEWTCTGCIVLKLKSMDNDRIKEDIALLLVIGFIASLISVIYYFIKLDLV